ncbi:MAG: FAD-dependent oxidoreductase [Pseudohongiellaceae bacterium]|nr:FAD-dependent oxidoreductase [Pseudohongiellaceae bacterium]
MNQPASHTEYDIVIIGGGMVGASLACALAESDMRVAIVDAGEFQAELSVSENFDPRVSAITEASRQFFVDLGVWPDIASHRHCAYTNMHVWEADGTASISFGAADIHADSLGHIIENSLILSALHARLCSSQVELIPNARLVSLRNIENEGCVVLSLEDGRELRASLLVAADGANSKVRSLAGFDTREWDYQHHAIVTTVKTEKPHCHTAIQRFMDQGVLAFLPLQDESGASQHYCSIVWSVLPEYAQQLMAQSDEVFALSLQAAIESRLGTVEHVDKRFSFPLRQRHAKQYVQHAIALIGDAAHSIHPLAGQGVNLGFLDAQALAEVLLAAAARGDDIASARILRRYQRRRIGHNLAMMGMMEGFKQLYADQPLPVRLLRNIGMSQLDKASALKNRVMRAAMGV